MNKKIFRKPFVLAFAITFATLSVAAMAVGFWVGPKRGPSSSGNQQNGMVYLPDEKDGMNLLLAVTQKKEDVADTFFLVRFDPVKGRIPVAMLPGSTKVTWEGRDALLREVYKTKGVIVCAKALEETFQIPVERYAKLHGDALSQAVNLIGEVETKLEKALTITKNEETVQLSPGVQRLDGDTVRALLFSQGFDGGEVGRSSFHAKLFSEFINQNLSLVGEQKADDVFQSVVNLMDTNLSFADYQSRKTAAIFLSSLKKRPASPVELSGQLNTAGNTYSLDEKTGALIQTLYGGQTGTP